MLDNYGLILLWCCFPPLGQAIYPLWWPSQRKTCKQNSFCVGVVWQT